MAREEYFLGSAKVEFERIGPGEPEMHTQPICSPSAALRR
jgi:hypothetical protein